jgi:hypothetical protein
LIDKSPEGAWACLNQDSLTTERFDHGYDILRRWVDYDRTPARVTGLVVQNKHSHDMRPFGRLRAHQHPVIILEHVVAEGDTLF